MHGPYGVANLIGNHELSEAEHEMDYLEIHEYARRFFEVQGAKAIAEAAQKARSFEENGDEKEAATWRQIEAALMEMRGPHQS